MTIVFRLTIWPLLKSFAKIAFSPILRPLLFFSHFFTFKHVFNLIILSWFSQFQTVLTNKTCISRFSTYIFYYRIHMFKNDLHGSGFVSRCVSKASELLYCPREITKTHYQVIFKGITINIPS